MIRQLHVKKNTHQLVILEKSVVLQTVLPIPRLYSDLVIDFDSSNTASRIVCQTTHSDFCILFVIDNQSFQTTVNILKFFNIGKHPNREMRLKSRDNLISESETIF